MRSRFADLLFNDGVDLLPDRAGVLESKLEADSKDMESRAMLLGFYYARPGKSARARRQHHLLWIIANRPEVDIAGLATCSLHPEIDGEAYHQAKKMWLKHLSDDHIHTAVMRNAGSFFARFEPDVAEDLYKKARAIEPDNPEWSIALGRLYRLAGIGGSELDVQQYATAALQEFEHAYAETSDELKRFYLLDDLAKSAIDAGNISKARVYADQLLQLAHNHRDDWNYGNAVHHGNIVLGRIALLEEDIEGAKGCLLKAGQTPGSPQLDSFGPNMVLAKELLEQSEQQVVLEYLTLCGKFWDCGQKQLRDWKKQIRGGCIPDFGVSLLH